jgi:hypothetical protein
MGPKIGDTRKKGAKGKRRKGRKGAKMGGYRMDGEKGVEEGVARLTVSEHDDGYHKSPSMTREEYDARFRIVLNAYSLAKKRKMELDMKINNLKRLLNQYTKVVGDRFAEKYHPIVEYRREKRLRIEKEKERLIAHFADLDVSEKKRCHNDARRYMQTEIGECVRVIDDDLIGSTYRQTAFRELAEKTQIRKSSGIKDDAFDTPELKAMTLEIRGKIEEISRELETFYISECI